MERIGDVEFKEKEPSQREVVLHFIRHGETEYSGEKDYEGNLTEAGKDQARQAAEKLFSELPEESVLAFYTSPRRRTIQTCEIIKEEIERISQESDKTISFHNIDPKTFKRIGIDDAATEDYLEHVSSGRDPVDEWLKNPNENTREIEKNLTSFLRKISAFSKYIDAKGPDVHIVIVSHTGPSEVFVAKMLDIKKLDTLANCEEFKVQIPVSEKKPVLTYKETSKEIEIS